MYFDRYVNVHVFDLYISICIYIYTYIYIYIHIHIRYIHYSLGLLDIIILLQ